MRKGEERPYWLDEHNRRIKAKEPTTYEIMTVLADGRETKLGKVSSYSISGYSLEEVAWFVRDAVLENEGDYMRLLRPEDHCPECHNAQGVDGLHYVSCSRPDVPGFYGFGGNMMGALERALERLGVKILYRTPYSDLEDAALYINDRLHIQVGRTYCMLAVKKGDGFVFSQACDYERAARMAQEIVTIMSRENFVAESESVA